MEWASQQTLLTPREKSVCKTTVVQYLVRRTRASAHPETKRSIQSARAADASMLMRAISPSPMQ